MNNLHEEHFLDIDEDMLKYLETQGEEFLKEVLESNRRNKDNGFKLLNLLLAGIGSSFLLLTNLQSFGYFYIALFFLMLLWFLCAVYLGFTIFKIHKRGAINTSPDYLYTKEYKKFNKKGGGLESLQEQGYVFLQNTLDVIRRRRLIDLCRSANDLVSINKYFSDIISEVIIYSIISPVVALFVPLFVFLIISFSIISLIFFAFFALIKRIPNKSRIGRRH